VSALEWVPARRSLRFAFGGYCFHETWFEGLELLTHVTRITASLDETTAAIAPLLDRHAAVFVPSHPVRTKAPPLQFTRHFIRYTIETTRHYYIEFDRPFDQHMRRLPRTHRHEIERKLRRYLDASDGGIDLRCYATPRDARRFYELARALSVKTYQDRLLGLGLPDTDTFRAELRGHAERGTMRGYLLFDRGQPIAFGYCAGLGDCLRFVFTGYDPAAADRSPGIVLVHEMVRSVAAEGRFAILDFGPGEGQYKRLFATASVPCATIYFLRPSPGHLVRALAHRTCTGASDGCGNVADWLGVKAQLRRWLRVRAPARAS
jgi:CelD/BcsL family acetyltransferase involved in cellulose biosynthesis